MKVVDWLRATLTQPQPVESRECSFSQLRHLLGGWFHQDFDIVGPDLKTILASYVSGTSNKQIQGAVADIERFLDLYGADDLTLRNAVQHIFDPDIIIEGWEGMNTREWLNRVAALLVQYREARKD